MTCVSAHAGTYTGNSATGYDDQGHCTNVRADNGDFDDPRNWGGACSPASVPGPGDTADLAGHGVHGTTINVGSLSTSGGSLVADTIATDNLSINGGTIAGRDATASTLSVSNSVSWTDGVISTLNTTFLPSCNATISHDYDNAGSGSFGKSINGGAVIHNQGTLNWSGASIIGGTIDNSGTFNLLGDGDIGTGYYGEGIILINSGTIAKISGSGTTSIGAATTFIDNGGTLQAQTGIFDPSSGYYSNSINNVTIAAGAGVVRQSTGWSCNGTLTLNGNLRITGGTTTGSVTYSGPGHIDWQGGGFGNYYYDSTNTLQHSNIVFAPSIHADMSGADTISVDTLTNQGLLTWSAGGNLAGAMKNEGTFNFLTDGALGGIYNGFSVVNTGTLAKTGGNGVLTIGQSVLDNSGIIDIQNGTLELSATPNGSSQHIRDGSVLKGAGKLLAYEPVISDGTITVDGTYQWGDGTTPVFAVIGGTYKGSGHIEWLGGTVSGVTFSPGFVVNVSGSLSKGFSGGTPYGGAGDSSNQGALNWQGGSAIGVNGTLTNSGTFNVLAAGNPFGGTLNNTGTINTFPGGTDQFNGTLNNSGTINLGNSTTPGSLSFYGGDPYHGFTMTDTSIINLSIAGAADGEFGQLVALTDPNSASHIDLGGTLNVSTVGSYLPDDASSFPIVKLIPDRASYSGNFSTINGLALSNGRSLKISYNGGDATLSLAPLPTVSINSPSISEGNSGSKNLAFTATLSAPSASPVTVKYATSNGTATAGKDYTSTSGTLTIPTGQTQGTINVPVIGDTLDEANETLMVNLSASTGATITTSQGIGTITDDDGTPTLKIGDVSVKEGNSGSTTASFPVTLSAASGQSITVKYATADGTAKAPGDYTSTSGTLTFAPGVTSQTVKVAVKGDTLDEPNETFLVKLSGQTNASISDGSGTGTITDDDAPPVLSVNSPSITEGNSGTKTLVFTIKLSKASGQIVTVSAKTGNATVDPATAGTDYVALASTKISFAVGEVSKTVSVTIKGDTLDEADEKFNLLLSAPTNATIGTDMGTGVGTILDDDATPSLSIADVSMAEGNSGTKSMVFTVTLSAASGRTVTVNFATADGTAQAGSDYVGQTSVNGGILSFAPGVTSKTISVSIKGDTVVEANETFNVVLSKAVAATLARGTAIGTIINDDTSSNTAGFDPSAASS